MRFIPPHDFQNGQTKPGRCYSKDVSRTPHKNPDMLIDIYVCSKALLSEGGGSGQCITEASAANTSSNYL